MLTKFGQSFVYIETTLKNFSLLKIPVKIYNNQTQHIFTFHYHISLSHVALQMQK